MGTTRKEKTEDTEGQGWTRRLNGFTATTRHYEHSTQQRARTTQRERNTSGKVDTRCTMTKGYTTAGCWIACSEEAIFFWIERACFFLAPRQRLVLTGQFWFMAFEYLRADNLDFRSLLVYFPEVVVDACLLNAQQAVGKQYARPLFLNQYRPAPAFVPRENCSLTVSLLPT